MAEGFDPKSEKLIQQLQSYYSFLTPTDLIGKYGTQSSKADNTPDQKVASVIMNTIFNTSFKGFYSLSDVARVFENNLATASDPLKKQFKKLVFVKADGLQLSSDKQKTPPISGLIGVPSTETDINNPDFKIGYILSQSPRISLGVKDTTSVAAFLNTIPTVEFVRAIPYLSVNFKTGRESLTTNGKFLNAPTVLRFLNGSAQVPLGSPDYQMATATSNSDASQPGFDHMGMEIFTSPIAMTPMSVESDPTLRSTRIIDINRPIMSIENMTVEVISPIGVFAYKTAGLNITLHDKSRLAEISDLVRAEGFGGAVPGAGIEITYGWSHPDDVTSGNVYGTLLNRSRITEVYSIINSKFNFTPSGEVKIGLSLAAKGGYDVHRAKILDGIVDSELTELQRLIVRIKELREAAGLASSDVMKEVRVYQVLDSAEAAERPDLKEFTKKLEEAIKTLRKLGEKNSSNKAAAANIGKELADILETVYKKKDEKGKGDGGLLGKIDRTINGAIDSKFVQLQMSPDPFLVPKEGRDTLVAEGKYPWDEELAKFETETPAPKGTGPKRKLISSLGAMLMSFIGGSMVNHQSVKEVQFVFHVFNDFAGLAGGQSIAAFPVDIEYFKDIFQKLARAKRDPNYTLEEFTRIVSEHVINNPRAIGYGMRSLYKVSNDKENAEALPKIEMEKNTNEEKVANQMTRIMGNRGGTFKFPILEAYIETLPRRILKEDKETNDLPENDSSYNIMRIHFYDKQSTPYEPVFDMLAAARGEQVNQNINEELPVEYKTDKQQTQSVLTAFATYVSQVNAAKTAEDKKKVPIPESLKDYGQAAFKAGGNIIIPGAADLLRDFIRETTPTITYGSNLSAVKSADVTTMQDAQQQAIFMKNAAKGNPTQPNGSDVGGLPVTILPTVVNMTTMGCPLISLMQQFFVDFGTGTTADNVYYVTGLSHEIGQGKFETRIKFTPGEAYGKFKPIKDALKQVSELLKIDSAGSK